MSLQVWLPLTKDLRNQGLNNISVTNHNATYTSTGGKLGGYYGFNGSSYYITFPQGYLGQKWSYSIWFYTGVSNINQCLGCCRTTTGQGFSIFLIGNGLRIDRGGGDNSTQWTTNYTITLNTWTHLTITCDTNIIKYYINGELRESNTTTLNSKKWGTIFSVGASQAGGSNYANYFKGRLNDVRVYDHCLSPMEVKQISQGLVLHYPLNRNGWGQENIVRNSNKFKTGGHASGVTPSVEVDGTYKVIAESGNSNYSSSWWWEMTGIEDSFVEDEPFTVSFWIKSSDANKTKPPTIYLKSGMGYYSMQGSVSANYSQVYYTGTWKKTNNLAPHLGWSGLVGTYYICHWKIEKGSIPTPWCPNSTDELATTMGLNSTTEYDCSGFCNNGIRYGTFSFNSETPKYAVSTQYNGTDNTLKIPFDASVWPDNFTMSIWFRKDELGSKNYETLFGGPSGFEMDTRSGSSSSLSIYMASTRGGNVYTGIEFGKWYMVTLVNDGTNELYYINGELVKTIVKKSMPVGNYWIGSWSSATSQNYKGLISDARVYATALSADDVKSLYQNCATIDPDGTIRGQIRS